MDLWMSWLSPDSGVLPKDHSAEITYGPFLNSGLSQ